MLNFFVEFARVTLMFSPYLMLTRQAKFELTRKDRNFGVAFTTLHLLNLQMGLITNKLEFYIRLGLKGLTGTNTLVYLAHL